MATTEEERGFEFGGEFYRMHFSDIGKDLMLIDRITGLSLPDFAEADPGRGPIMLALIATSIRHAHPDWSVERIHGLVINLSMSEDITWVGAGEDEEAVVRPPELTQNGSTGTSSASPSASTSSGPLAEPSGTFNAIPA